MKLSILIPTVHRRKALFDRVFTQLNNQIKALKAESLVEIVSHVDGGQNKIGKKRNELLEASKGEYVCFVDDDDRVSDEYVSFLLKAIETKPDVVALNGIITFDGKDPKRFAHSLKYNRFYNDHRTYYRPPNHLNCIKREHAITVKFKEINHGEDTDWAMRLMQTKLLKNEYYHDKILYHYLFVTHKHY
jgi:glycosyltransferase involved in cell wall biosynthesis